MAVSVDQVLPLALRAVRETREAFGRENWQGLGTLLLQKERDWHQAVLLPIGLAQHLVLQDARLRARINQQQLASGDFERLLQLNLMACDLAAMLPWDLTKGAYLFDADLFEALITAPLERLPAALLTRLPEYAPLLVFPQPWQGAVAAWVHLDVDNRFGNPHLEFRALLLAESGRRLPLLLDLKEDILEDCIQATQEETLRSQQVMGIEGVSFPQGVFPIVRGLLNLTLYLASEEPDLSQRPRPLPKLEARRRDAVPRVYPEASPQRIEVGWRLGAALREARQAQRTASGVG
jgi:hypothetical protein